ncbi:MAG: protein kinase [Coxiellaceae bacterium]|nr:protein kinase [Coxiellaceae bacterium]
MPNSKKIKPKKTEMKVMPLALRRLHAATEETKSTTSSPLSSRVIAAMRCGEYRIDATQAKVIGYGVSGDVTVCQIVLPNDEIKWAARKNKDMVEVDRHLRAMQREGKAQQSSVDTHVVSLLGWDDEYMYTSLGELGSVRDLDIPRRLAQASTVGEQSKWLSYIFQVTKQVAQGLCHIHSNHIVHGDIKGQNLFANKTGDVFIGDFGLSRTARDSEWYKKKPDLQNAWGVLAYLLDDFNVPSDQLDALKIIKQEFEGVYQAGENFKRAPIQSAQHLLDRLQVVNRRQLFKPVVLQSKPSRHGRYEITAIKFKKRKSRRSLSQGPRGRVAELKQQRRRRSSSTPASLRTRSSLFQVRKSARQAAVDSDELHPNVTKRRGRWHR